MPTPNESDDRPLPPGIVRSKPKAGEALPQNPNVPPGPGARSARTRAAPPVADDFEEEIHISRDDENAPRGKKRRGRFTFPAASGEEEVPSIFTEEGGPALSALLVGGGRSQVSEPLEARITSLEAQARRDGRTNVYVNGAFALGVNDDVVLSLGLHVGQAITPERLTEITRAENVKRAKEYAYQFLGYRARSEREIADRLTRKGYDEETIALVTESLRSYGFVDDASFAASWVSARGKTRGTRALAFELRQKGIADETARETLADAKNGDTERAAALLVARKKVGAGRPLDTSREAQAKVAALLQRRGFGWDVIRPVLAEIYTGEGEGEEEIAD